MNLYTTVSLPGGLPRLEHDSRLMLLGSCFATGMGARLTQAKFCCDVNPYGVLYNPLSISTALREVVARRHYAEADLCLHGGLWHSPMHHGDFSRPDPQETLGLINTRIDRAHALLDRLDCLLLTLGTAYVYRQRSTGRVVGNCHKMPETDFVRTRLTVDEIAADYTSLLSGLLARRPGLHVAFTVSPIRHLRDGLHANQLSKATLLLAVDRLTEAFAGRVSYFPAYEIVVDELRDYRFYGDDLVHPTPLAADCVWERFAQACLSPQARQAADECAALSRMLAHRPLHPGSEQHRAFLQAARARVEQLAARYPYADFQQEYLQTSCNTPSDK